MKRFFYHWYSKFLLQDQRLKIEDGKWVLKNVNDDLGVVFSALFCFLYPDSRGGTHQWVDDKRETDRVAAMIIKDI